MSHLDPDCLYHEYPVTPGQAPLTTHPQVLEYAMAFWRSAIVLSAYELGMFAELALGPRTASELARTLGLHGDAVVDMLEALATLDLVEPAGSGYRTTGEASIYLDPGRPTYVGAWLDMAGNAMREMANLTTQLRTDGAAPKAHPPLAERMWADVADILNAAYPEDRV